MALSTGIFRAIHCLTQEKNKLFIAKIGTKYRKQQGNEPIISFISWKQHEQFLRQA